jgi:hypothetical protein
MPAFDFVLHTAAVLDTSFAALRAMRAGRQHFWPNGQAELWLKMGLINVTEVLVVVDCEYPAFAEPASLPIDAALLQDVGFRRLRSVSSQTWDAIMRRQRSL